MELLQNRIAQTELIEDLKISFNQFLNKNDPKEINIIWQNLHHAKQSGWFDNDFYIYWLVKCINTPDAQGVYVLCLPSITKDVCGLNERELGDFLMPRINFVLSLNDFSKAISMINFALQGSAIFEKSWLINKLNYIGLEDKVNLLKINAENEAIFLNYSL
jgi:hypothetical protein